MCGNKFTRCEMDHCCYSKKSNSWYIILLLYVDGMLIARSSMREINRLNHQLSKEFDMKDLRAANHTLGIRIMWDRLEGVLKLSKRSTLKIERVLDNFRVQYTKPRSTPKGSHFKLLKEQPPMTYEKREYLGKVPYVSTDVSLIYTMICTRPNIARVVEIVRRYMANLGMKHWEL